MSEDEECDVVNVMFTMKIDSGNAAMVEAPESAVADLLRGTAAKVESGIQDGFLMDANGNRVGSYSLTIDTDRV